MLKKNEATRWQWGFIAICVLIALFLWGISPSVAAAQKRYTFGTSPMGGTWYVMSSALADLFNKNIPGISITVEGTAGGAINPKLMSAKTIELGFQVMDMFNNAKAGVEPFEKKYDLDHARTICFQGVAATHFVVLKKSGINGLKDLKGKRVSIGDRGASINTRIWWFLEAAGMGKDDIKPQMIGDEQAAGALTDGRIDCMAEILNVPAGSMLNLATTEEVKFLELTDQEVTNLKRLKPYMSPINAPPGVYKQPNEIKMWGVPSVFMIINSVPDDLVYQMCKLIDANRDYLLKTHKSFNDLKFDPNLEADTGVPLHPGALKFYKEKGLIK